MRIAVFSCLGLGDGLITAVLANNLVRHGGRVTLFHPFFHQLQAWFPHIDFRPFPPSLEEFDRYFVVYERSDWMRKVLDEALSKFRSQTTVLNPIATPNTDYPFWEEGRFDGKVTFVDNLYVFCRDILKIPNPTRENGIVVPPSLVPRRHEGRVVIHPTSSRPGKNWPRLKFLKLAQQLRSEGMEPVFIVGPEERKEWPEAPIFASLNEMAAFVCESGYMIGNDSGIGHLASNFGLPTLTLCKNSRTADFWKPSWAPNQVVLPLGWLPNIKGLRWRDHHWQWGISVRRVRSEFNALKVRKLWHPKVN